MNLPPPVRSSCAVRIQNSDREEQVGAFALAFRLLWGCRRNSAHALVFVAVVVMGMGVNLLDIEVGFGDVAVEPP